MGAGRFVGRIGGLAVALGVGMAVASCPAVASADDGGSTGAESAPPSSTSGGTDGAATTTATSTEPSDASTAAGSDPTGTSPKTDATDSNTSTSTGASVRQTPPGTVLSTGGADSSTKDGSAASTHDDPVKDSTTHESTVPKPVKKAPQRHGSNHQQSTDDPTGTQLAQANTQTSTTNPVPTRPKASSPVPHVASEQPVESLNVKKAMPQQADFVAVQAVSAAQTESVSPLSAVVLAALGTVGLGPLAPGGPLTPVNSPLELTLLAMGARSRTSGQQTIEETGTFAIASSLTGESVDSDQTFAATAMAAAVNSAPVVPTQPVGTPDPVTGVVTGTVSATDAENNPLTYTVANGPTSGTVELNSTTGAYTYRPTEAARLAAGGTAIADTDSFTVAVSDGQQSATATVSVYILPTRLTTQAPIPVGANPSGVVIGTDGRMYVANTGSGTISVINTVTGQRIDANSSYWSKDIGVGSSPSALALSADGKRLYVANTGSGTVSVIDTTTYKRIDVNPSYWSSDIKVGSSPSALALGADGRLYVANRGSNTVSVIDTTTNQLVDTNSNVTGIQSISVGSAPSALVLNGTQLYVINRDSNSVSVINTSGYSVANTLPVGTRPSAAALGSGGRLYVANTGSATVSVINTATNTVGVNAIPVGPSPSSVAFSPDGSFAYVANANDTVTVIDTATAKVLRAVAIDTDTTGGHVVAVASNGTIYVTDAADNTVRVVAVAQSTGLFTLGDTTITGDRPGSLMLNANGTRALLITAYPRGTVTYATYPDGIYGSTTRVAVIDTVSGSQLGTTFTMIGAHAAAVQLSADGTRALITSNASDGTHVAVLNMTTGAQVGNTFTLTGWGSAQFIANDSRALITTTAQGTTTTTRVAVLNTTTGTQVGATLTLAGNNSSAALSPDGIHALIFTDANVAALNTVTGTTTAPTLSGSWTLERWSANGSRALISSKVTDATGTSTRFAVIDATTGAQSGTTLTVIGNGSVQSSPDGTRALITTKVTSAGSTTTRLAVFNTTTGTQIGATLVLTGDGAVQANTDGSRALITSDVYDSATASHSTQLTVFNTVTGTQIGTSLTLTGGLLYGVQPKFSPDGTRALITTDVYDAATTLRTSRVTTIDTTTGTKIGTTLTLNGPEPVETTWRADGKRALLTMTPTQYDSVSAAMLVAVLDTTTGTQVGTTLSLTGMPTYGVKPVITPDGTRALITTNDYSPATGTTVRVTTVDTTTGNQVGTTITLTASSSGRTMLIPNTNRAVLTADDQVAIINPTTGTQVGTTVAVGGTSTPALFSADGSRVLITTPSNLTVIDTITGAQVGTTVALTPTGPRSIVTLLTPDGTHALVTTQRRYIGDAAISATPVTMIDLTNGTQIGTTLSLTGDTYASPAFTLNGTRALIATTVEAPNGVTTRVTTINTATGMPIGTTVTLTGALTAGVDNPQQVLLSPDGARALIATTSTNSYPGTSQVAVIDTSTGRQIGDVVTVSGSLSRLRWSTDGTRVFVTTYITTSTGSDLSVRETVLTPF